MKNTRSKKHVYTITGGQIWLALIIAVIGLTIAFEVGVSVGKKRVIEAERESRQQDNIQVESATKLSNQVKLPGKPSQDQPAEPSEAEVKTAKYTVQVGTYRSRQGAEEMMKLLESYEYAPWMKIEPETETTSLHSVMVGKFDTREEAEKYGRAMQNSLSYVTSYMVREISE
jgi:cell division septation protein DedD